MVSLARLIVDNAERRGVKPTADDLAALPPFQWDIWWNDLSPLCPSRLGDWAKPERATNRNRLRVEDFRIGTPRCAELSPDGRGLVWVASGGSVTAYGECCLARCPLRNRKSA